MLKFDEWMGWLAGIMDGEGTIGIFRANCKTAKHPYLKSTFQMSNTNLAIIEKWCEIVRSYGIKPTIVLTNKGVANCKVGFRASIGTRAGLLKILPLIIPYLVSKREQAELLLGFCKRRFHIGPHGYKWYQTADVDFAAYQRCLELNRRGVVTVESGADSSLGEPRDEGAFRTNRELLEGAEMTLRQLRLVNK